MRGRAKGQWLAVAIKDPLLKEVKRFFIKGLVPLCLSLLLACEEKEAKDDKLYLVAIQAGETNLSAVELEAAFQDCAESWPHPGTPTIARWEQESDPPPYRDYELYFHFKDRPIEENTIVFVPAHYSDIYSGLGMPPLALVFTWGDREYLSRVICHELEHIYLWEGTRERSLSKTLHRN